MARRRVQGHVQIRELGARGRSTLPPALDALLSHWSAKRAGLPLPPREAVPMGELQPWLANLALIEVRGGDHFKFVFCGINLIVRLGREATGSRVDALAADIAMPLQTLVQQACAAKAPLAMTASVTLSREAVLHADLALPLAAVDGSAGALLVASYPLAARAEGSGRSSWAA